MLCRECACAIVNCDYSGMDEETADQVEIFVESAGLIDIDTEPQSVGQFDCHACGEHCYGDAYGFERVV